MGIRGDSTSCGPSLCWSLLSLAGHMSNPKDHNEASGRPPEESPVPPSPVPDLRPSQLSQEQKGRVDAWFRNKLSKNNPACPMCGERKWTLLEDLVAPTNFTRNAGFVIGGM